MGDPRIQSNRRYGLKDLLHALLFLFYEPNFAHAWNVGAAVAEEGLTMEETIEKTFHGGFVNGIKYEPNNAWLLWTKENANESVHDPSEDQSVQVMSSVIKSGFDDFVTRFLKASIPLYFMNRQLRLRQSSCTVYSAFSGTICSNDMYTQVQ